MKKDFALLIFSLILPELLFAQRIENYFYQVANYTYSAKFKKNYTGGELKETEIVWLKENKSSFTINYSVNFSQSAYTSDWQTMNSTTYKIQITKDAVISDEQTIVNTFFPDGSTRKDRITLVTLPLETGPRHWTEVQNETHYDCKAEWSYIRYKGNEFKKVIKITKTNTAYGSKYVETYYWAESLGLVWETLTTDEEKTVLLLDDIGNITEISEEEYSWESFIKNRKKVNKSIRGVANLYSDLIDVLSNDLVNLKYRNFKYYTDNAQPSSVKGSSSIWPSFQIKYEATVSINNGSSIQVSSDNTYYRFDNTHDKWFIDKSNDKLNGDLIKGHLKESLKNSSITLPHEIEPISNKTYTYNTSDIITIIMDVDCYVFKVKKTKKGYKLIKGDTEVWNECSNSIDIESLFKEDLTTNYIKVLRFSCNEHLSYRLVEKATVKDDYEGQLYYPVGYGINEIDCVLLKLSE